MNGNALSALVVVASAVIPYLISQTDVLIPPILKVLLIAANIGLVAFSRFSNPNATPVQVEVTAPVPVVPVAPPEEGNG